MHAIPKMTKPIIQATVGRENLQRGSRYINANAIVERLWWDGTLKARCKEEQGEDRHCLVTFDAKNIAQTYCTCKREHCEHIAALLLAWMKQPETFSEQEPLPQILDRYEKATLAQFLQELILREPALEVQLDALLAGSKGAQVTVNRAAYRLQVERIFDRDMSKWGAYQEIAKEVGALLRIGDELLQRDENTNAAVLYSVVFATTIEQYATCLNSSGELTGVVEKGAVDLIQCLVRIKDDKALRKEILRALFDVYDFFLFSEDDMVVYTIVNGLLREASTDEKQIVAGWVRQRMQGEDEDEEAQESITDFLFDLEADTLDDETYLRYYRKTKRYDMVVERLLERGHVKEALAEMSGTVLHEQDLIDVADVFVSYGHAAEAQQLMQNHGKAE